MVHLASIGATGTSVNPARSIGVGVFAGGDAIIQLWLFILAPLAGGAIAGITYPMLFGHGSDPVPGSGLRVGPGRGARVRRPGPAPAGVEPGDPRRRCRRRRTQEPIVQDGWQWDHDAQEWKPQDQPPAAPAAPTAPPASRYGPADSSLDPAGPSELVSP